MSHTLFNLRQFAISNTLFPATTLKQAFSRLKFVQIDPIRSPARAQDLILRHRVKNYQIGEIETHAPKLGLEEDFLYAHGYMIPQVWQLLHPRKSSKLSAQDQAVWDKVKQLGEIHPKRLGDYFESKQERNWWGGQSQTAKMSLERLHYYGLVRVARREKGLRIYQPIPDTKSPQSPQQRLENLILHTVQILAPVTAKTLNQALFRVRRFWGPTKPILDKLIQTGELMQQNVAGVSYIWPAKTKVDKSVPDQVKFLAPFDPLVWDRIRFEHLWGWPYRFEAYTPLAKRVRGYYAMPLLWKQDIVGWANLKVINGQLDVDLGFVNQRPLTKAFDQALEAEVARVKVFLKLERRI